MQGDLVTLPIDEDPETYLDYSNVMRYIESSKFMSHLLPFCSSVSTVSYDEAHDAIKDSYLAHSISASQAQETLHLLGMGPEDEWSIVQFIALYAAP